MKPALQSTGQNWIMCALKMQIKTSKEKGMNSSAKI